MLDFKNINIDDIYVKLKQIGTPPLTSLIKYLLDSNDKSEKVDRNSTLFKVLSNIKCEATNSYNNSDNSESSRY